MQETGINLIEKAFEQVTDQQIKAYKLKTGKQRTPALAAGASVDSTQIASNIREMSRLQLLVEVLPPKLGCEALPSQRAGHGRAFAKDRRTDAAFAG